MLLKFAEKYEESDESEQRKKSDDEKKPLPKSLF